MMILSPVARMAGHASSINRDAKAPRASLAEKAGAAAIAESGNEQGRRRQPYDGVSGTHSREKQKRQSVDQHPQTHGMVE